MSAHTLLSIWRSSRSCRAMGVELSSQIHLSSWSLVIPFFRSPCVVPKTAAKTAPCSWGKRAHCWYHLSRRIRSAAALFSIFQQLNTLLVLLHRTLPSSLVQLMFPFDARRKSNPSWVSKISVSRLGNTKAVRPLHAAPVTKAWKTSFFRDCGVLLLQKLPHIRKASFIASTRLAISPPRPWSDGR